MKVSITQFRELARDANGNLLPLGDDRLGCEVRTADGAFAALGDATRLVRVATDTSIHMDISGGSTSAADELFLAGTVEYIAVKGGEVLTILTA